MAIKQQGGIFGRNPTFNDVEVENDLTVDGTTTLSGTTIPSSKTLLVTTDIGSTVQGYDADTAKLDVAQTFSAEQKFNNGVVFNEGGIDVDFRIESDTDDYAFFLDGENGNVRLGTPLRDSSLSNFNVCAVAPTITFKNGSVASADDVLGEIRVFSADGGTGIFDNRYGGSIKFKAEGSSNTYHQPTYISFETNDSSASSNILERLRITSNGNVDLKTGNLVIGTSGKGIDFSATSGTGTSELFDDYEEGTWTPTLSNFGGTPTVSGSYTKIGNLVYLEFSVQLDGTSDTSSYQVLGLPYTPTDVGGGYIARTDGGYADGLVSITPASSRIDVKDSSNSGVNYNTFGNSSTTKFVVFYRVA
jgi:hypothetical protein